MNLTTDEITIRDNKIISDNRNGANCTMWVASKSATHNIEKASIFTNPNEDNTELHINFDKDLIILSLDKEELKKLFYLIEAYVDQKADMKLPF